MAAVGRSGGFTPGPWYVEHSATAGLRVVHGPASDLGFRDDVRQGRGEVGPDGEQMANVILIAAAPDLLVALEPFAKFACDPPCGCHNCIARAAIAKARGIETATPQPDSGGSHV